MVQKRTINHCNVNGNDDTVAPASSAHAFTAANRAGRRHRLLLLLLLLLVLRGQVLQRCQASHSS